MGWRIWITWLTIFYIRYLNNPSIRIYINKIENKIMFKIKTGYYLKLLTPETMKLCGSTKSKIKKMKMVKVFLI